MGRSIADSRRAAPASIVIARARRRPAPLDGVELNMRASLLREKRERRCSER
jgi:hypothetical protein